MTRERTTYEARNAQFKIDPTKWAEVVSAMSSYLFDERMKYENNGGEQGRFPTYLRGKGKRLAISTQVGVLMGSIELVGSHDLVSLVQSEDGSELTFNVHAHPKLDVDPKRLYRIGKSYNLE